MGYESYFRKRQSQAGATNRSENIVTGLSLYLRPQPMRKSNTATYPKYIQGGSQKTKQHKIATESFLDLLKKLENASKFKISISPNRACRFISHKNGSDADSCVTPVF
jgi:hypothetical protein